MKMICWLLSMPFIFCVLIFIDYKIRPYKKRNNKYRKIEIYMWSFILTIYFYTGIILWLE